MSWNHRTEKRAWVIAALLTAAACESGDDGPGELSQPEPSTSDDAEVPSTASDAGDTLEPTDGGVMVDATVTVDPRPDASSSPPDASAQPDAASDAGPSPAFMRGKALADETGCAGCHGSAYAGAGFFPNITPHPSAGIGSWTDEQIAAAIAEGVNEKGEQLCSGMERYDFTASELSDLIAFLRGLSPSAKVITAVCPGHGQ